jgi:phenylpropionate dioxygenase-like ring-hydroxylating dioxygenase large terminal subunit
VIEVRSAKRKSVFPNQLEGRDYCDEKILKTEQCKIFARSWLFAGSAASLRENHDFLVLNIGDWSIIVSRLGGQIKAFENRCTHRSSPIHRCDFGNRPLKCPFHGWAFNDEGHLAGVPQNNELFGFGDAEKKRLALKQFEIGLIGDLIFVRMPEVKQSLKEFLGPVFESLRVFNGQWTTRGNPEVSTIQANWKLIVEIALEAYHAAENHPLSLGAQGVAPTSVHHFTTTKQGHQVLNIGNFPTPELMTQAATIIFIFPNMFAIQLDGKFCSLLSILPRETEKTELRSFCFYDRGHPVSTSLFTSLSNSLRMTNLEDQRICESVQQRVHHQRKGQPLGAVEESLYRFQKAYLQKRSWWRF